MSIMEDRVKNVENRLDTLEDGVSTLTKEFKEAVQSLKEIAHNTANMGELINVYDKWKGFAWVMKSVGFYGALIIAFVFGLAVPYLTK